LIKRNSAKKKGETVATDHDDRFTEERCRRKRTNKVQPKGREDAGKKEMIFKVRQKNTLEGEPDKKEGSPPVLRADQQKRTIGEKPGSKKRTERKLRGKEGTEEKSCHNGASI